MICTKKQILLLLVSLVAGTVSATTNLRANAAEGEASEVGIPRELAVQDERELTGYPYHIQRKAPYNNYDYCLEWGHDDYVYVKRCDRHEDNQQWFYYYGYLVPYAYRNQHQDYYKCLTWDYYGSGDKNLKVVDCRYWDYKYGIFQYWNYHDYKFISAYLKHGDKWCIDHNRGGGDVAHMRECKHQYDYDQEWKVQDSFWVEDF